MSKDGNEAKKLIDELSQIEFDSGSDIAEWAKRLRTLLKAMAMEIDYGAQELEARLGELPAPEGSSQVVVARKARAVGRHARRAAEATQKSGIEVVRTWASLERHFGYLLAPATKKKPTLDLNS